ncbi:MAG: hypothetical protein HYZ32_00940, partial [Hydrocarboniphaga effusa]|nr:hypothetical protein [Hydrocarboniphaga effusa]
MDHKIGFAVIGALTLLASVASAHEAPPPPRTVSVGGDGEVTTAPDRARLVMAVDRLSPDLKVAQA